MDTQKVRAEVADIIARVRISHEPEEVVGMIMSVIEDVAGDEYERGRSDGQFNESFYGGQP